MLLLCNCGLQTANALDDFAFPTASLLRRREGETATAGDTKLGTGGEGQEAGDKLEKMSGGQEAPFL